MWPEFLSAMALVLIMEGMLPFLNPERWRRTMTVVAKQNDSALRVMGLVSMFAGLVLLYAVR